MQQRLLGGTGLSVSRLALGTMTWGRDTDEHEAREQLAAFVGAGGTLVDTAAGYTDGDSERLIGSLIGDVCEQFTEVALPGGGLTLTFPVTIDSVGPTVELLLVVFNTKAAVRCNAARTSCKVIPGAIELRSAGG